MASTKAQRAAERRERKRLRRERQLAEARAERSRMAITIESEMTERLNRLAVERYGVDNPGAHPPGYARDDSGRWVDVMGREWTPPTSRHQYSEIEFTLDGVRFNGGAELTYERVPGSVRERLVRTDPAKRSYEASGSITLTSEGYYEMQAALFPAECYPRETLRLVSGEIELHFLALRGASYQIGYERYGKVPFIRIKIGHPLSVESFIALQNVARRAARASPVQPLGGGVEIRIVDWCCAHEECRESEWNMHEMGRLCLLNQIGATEPLHITSRFTEAG